MKILIATSNEGKAREFSNLLSELVIEVTWLNKEGVDTVIEETGNSFYENAVLKAKGYSKVTGLTTLADDSGLEVDALGGQPGVRSARFAGIEASDDDRNQRILHALKDVPWEKRTARFKAVVAFFTPDEKLITGEGILEGFIARELVGEHGFGYDPLLYLPEFEKTVAELPLEVKNKISHRARAIKAIIPDLTQLIRNS